MFGILNANIGSVSNEIYQKDGKQPFFVLSLRDINVMDNAPDSDKWVTAFVRAETVEKLLPLKNALKVGHYVNVVGRPGASINMYEGKVSPQKSIATTPGQVTLMGAPLGTGKPSQDGETVTPAAEPAPQDNGQQVAVGATAGGGAANLDEVGF